MVEGIYAPDGTFIPFSGIDLVAPPTPFPPPTATCPYRNWVNRFWTPPIMAVIPSSVRRR